MIFLTFFLLALSVESKVITTRYGMDYFDVCSNGFGDIVTNCLPPGSDTPKQPLLMCSTHSDELMTADKAYESYRKKQEMAKVDIEWNKIVQAIKQAICQDKISISTLFEGLGHKLDQANIDKLKAMGYRIVEPSRILFMPQYTTIEWSPVKDTSNDHNGWFAPY